MKFETIRGKSNSGKTTKCWMLLKTLLKKQYTQEVLYQLTKSVRGNNLKQGHKITDREIDSFLNEKTINDFFSLIKIEGRYMLIYSESDCTYHPHYLKGLIASLLLVGYKIDLVIHAMNDDTKLAKKTFEAIAEWYGENDISEEKFIENENKKNKELDGEFKVMNKHCIDDDEVVLGIDESEDENEQKKENEQKVKELIEIIEKTFRVQKNDSEILS